jgi:predicted ATPase/DNA-binding CsgD family transcriptional regulator
MSNQKQTLPVIQENILFSQRDGQVSQLTVGTPAWYTWLNTATAFAFRSTIGTFTARREQAGHKRGGWYWRAYRKQKGKLHQVYMGKAEDLTLERLKDIAAHLAASCMLDPEQACHSTTGIVRQPTSDVPSPVSSKSAPSTLPSPFTSLIGREPEITAASALLTHPQVRLLTLTGTGGVGKTRLALAIAARMHDVFADGVNFVSLAALRDAELVWPTVVQGLGLQGRNRPPLEELQAELRERQCLLVLDNFEQVVTAAPSLVDLLAACPRLKLLVTSREVLHVRGEREYVVQPLTLPDPERLDDKTLADYSAVALFLERAQEVQPTFELTVNTAPLVTEICRRLDGLPLALELAAARLKVLSLQTLRERLEHRLHILTGGPRDLPARQQTLRRTIAWSYDLLSSEEQRLFRLLSAFVSGCTLEAAETAYSQMGGERAQVLDLVTSLLDKHLLYQGEQSDRAPRFLLHETMREYGLEALAATQELGMAQQAHAEYYVGLVVLHFENKELIRLLGLLEHEYANLHAALQWVVERPANEITLRLEIALLHFWERDQHRDESRTPSHEQGAAPVQEAIALQHRPEDTHLRSLYLPGLIAWIIGDFVMARMYTERGLAKARDSDEKITLAYLTDLSGQIALDQGEDNRARTLLEEGFLLHQEAGDTLGSLNTLFFLERALSALGEVDQARTRASEHLALARAIGYQPGITGTLIFLGRLALEEGNVTRARELFDESLALLCETNENSPLTVTTSLQGIGITLVALGRLTEAVRLWGAAETLCTSLPEERALVARARATARARLGEEEFTKAEAEGQAMTLEQALAAIQHIVHSDQPFTQDHHRHSFSDLTAREKEVLRLVARGLPDAQIAEKLVISPRTVNAHLRSIYTKLRISSRNAATYFALEHGLI